MGRNGTVASTTTLPVPGRPAGVALVDLNGDRKADIVVTRGAQACASVLLSH
jgi:hypothetical protein